MELSREVDPAVARRMGYSDIRAAWSPDGGFTEIALVGPGSVFAEWSVVTHEGCDPDSPEAGTSGVAGYQDEPAAVAAYEEAVAAAREARSGMDPRSIAAEMRACIADGSVPSITLMALAASALEKVPSVFFTVEDGMGHVRAVDGEVEVYHVDHDKEGEVLTDEDIEHLLLPGRYSGTAADVAEAADESREALARYKDSMKP